MSDDLLTQLAERVRLQHRARRAAAGPRGRSEEWARGRVSPPAGTWSADRVVEAIQRWVLETGSPPSATAWVGSRPQRSTAAEKWQRERPRWPSADTVRRLCGSWPAALQAAGCPESRPSPELPYAERIAQAQRMAARGESTAAIADHVGVSPDTVRRYLRADACRGCGAPITASASGYCARCIFRATHVALYTREEILQRLREWAEQTGAAPRLSDWAPSARGSPNRYEREYPHWPPASSATAAFGSWRAMLRAADLRAHQREAWTRQDILDALTDGAVRFGRTPTIALAQRDERLPSTQTVSRHFGTWNAALLAAGLPPTRLSPRQWDQPAILDALHQFERAEGRAPTSSEFSATTGLPGANTVAAHFGSWNRALIAAGLTRAPRPRRWGEAAVIAAMRAFATEYGRRPKARDFAGGRQHGRWPHPSTVSCCCGSWNRALEKAGI